MTNNIMIPSIIIGDCRVNRVLEFNSNSLINEIVQSLLNETDCSSLEQKIIFETRAFQKDIQNTAATIERKLAEISPALKLPTNPFKIPKWLKKLALGSLVPDFEATLRLMVSLAETARQLDVLIGVINNLETRLRNCAIEQERVFNIDNIIQQSLFTLDREIQTAITNAICSTIEKSTERPDIFTAISTTMVLSDNLRLLNNTIENTLGNNLNTLNQNQLQIQEITGIAPILDTSNTQNFVSSAANANNYFSEINQLFEQEDVVNIELPIITGNIQVNSVLSCSNGIWGGNNISYSYHWYKDGQPILGANTFEYTPVIADTGSILACQVQAENELSVEQVFTSETDPVVLILENGDTPGLSGFFATSRLITCSSGNWPGDPLFFMYQWERVVPSGSNVIIQSASSNNTYFTQVADAGFGIKCKVIAQYDRYAVSVFTNTSINIVLSP